MKRMGQVISPQGAPLANRAVTVRDWATGGVVTTLQTNASGRWEVDLPDETKQYWVDVWQGGSSSQLTVQTPASIELEYLFVRYGATFKAAVNLPPGTSIGGITIDPGAPPGTGALDPRYVQKAGDAMTGALAINRNDIAEALFTTTASAATPQTAPTILGQRARGTIAAPAAVQSGDHLMRYDGLGYQNGAYRLAARVAMLASAAPSGNVVPGIIYLQTADAAGVLQNRMSIDHTGKAIFNGLLVPAAGLDLDSVQGTIYVRANTAPVDNKTTIIYAPAGDGRLRFAAMTDAGVTGTQIIDITRTGNQISTLTLTSGIRIMAEGRGHRIGQLGVTGATGGVLDTDAGLFLYNISPNNWSGLGGDGSGNMWWRVGLSGSPAPLLQLMANPPNLRIVGQLDQSGGYAYIGAVNSQARPRQGTDLGVNWNFSGAAAEMSLWNTVYNPTNSFVFRQLLSATTHRDLLTIAATGAITTAAAQTTVNGVLTLQNSNASIDTINMKNPSYDGTTWIFGIQGPAANVAWPGALSLYNTVAGAIMQVYNDGRIGIGGQAINGAGISGTVAISARSSAHPALRVMWGASLPAASPIMRVDRSDGALIFGVNNNGWQCDTYSSKAPTNNSTNAHIPVYNSVGTFIGFIVLYN